MRAWLRKLAWPDYDCEDCIGMIEHGCYCGANDAEAPCAPPRWWRKILRRVI